LSFFIRRRIDRHGDLRSLLGWIQLLMGSLALISVPLYLGTFDAMAFWMEAIQRNEPGYTAFTLFSHFLCFVLMLPATFCAGMTLPIITAALIREGGGEREIGRVYAANTLGSIAGVLVAVHVLMPLAGLRLTVMIGAFVDVALGFVLLLGAGVARRHWLPAAASIAALSVTIGLAVQFDPRITGSGVYRHEGVTKNLQEVLFSADGKTATVNVFRYPKSISISTNGKIDAGISTDGTASADDYTMILAAFLPMAHHPQIETAAVIGMGSGRSTHALLHDRRVRMVDTIEIEPAMVQGARQFGDLSDKAFTDARSHIHIEDAKAYFARQGQRYDLILSEPSNPWVSGVASLFTGEFYAQMKRHLKPGGLLVQWLHLYEIDLPLAASVINALTDEFEDYVAYVTNGSDLLLVARADGKVAPLDASVLENADLAPLWTHLGLKSADDLLIRRIGSLDTLAPWMRVAQGASNSDYFPILDQGAVKQRFLRSNAISLTRAVSYARRLELGESPAISGRVADAPLYKPVGLANNAFHYAQYFSAGTGSAEQLDRPLPQELLSLHHDLWLVEQNCSPELADGLWLPALQTLTTLYGPYVPAEPAKLIAARLRKAKCLAGSPLGLALVDLFEAVTQRNWSQTIVAAEKLLESQNAGFPGEDFVVAELLLADIKKNGYPAALNRSAKLGDRMPNSAPILYLRANIGL
jgi:spermidine synthase